MTSLELQRHTERRRERARVFTENPERFKVCDHCQSIAPKRARLCPICGGYCWHEDAATVIATAKVIGEHPFPQTAGVVPRF